MEFGLTEEQILLQDSIGKFLEETSSLDNVRDIAEGNRDSLPAIVTGLTALGVNGLLIPEIYGGLGMSFLDAALVQEVLGRHVTPAPFTSNAMAIIGLLTAGTEEQKLKLLAAIADGSAQFGVAISERTGAREGASVTSSGETISGKALFVTGFDGATHFMVCNEEGGLYTVSADAEGLTKQALTTIDGTRPIGELTFNKVTAKALPMENEKGAAARKMIAAGRVLLAADTLGAGQMMIEKAVDYAKERKQFNRVIGSFQAVKHLCAEMAAELEPCRSLIWYAAHTFDAIPDEAELMACHAKSHLAEVGQFVARTSTEVHGGVGFTDLLGLHYWFKRIGLNRQLFGSPERARTEAARLQGWAA